MSIATLNVAPTGWRQIASDPQGYSAQYPLRDRAVKMPFDTAQTNLDASGSATAQLQSGGTNSNADGSNTAISIVVPTYTGTKSGARIWVRFWGSVFGIRFLLTSTSTAPFSCKVNGRAYKIDPYDLYITAEQRTFADGENLVFVVDNLPQDRVNHAIISFPSPPSGSTAVTVYGLLLDGKAGYLEMPRTVGIASSGTLTASLANINLGSSTNTARGFLSCIYSNVDTVSVSALTNAGAGSTVATGTVASTTGMVVGGTLVISGATQPEYNGIFTIASIVSATQFTYNFNSNASATITTPATGTILAAWKAHQVTVSYNGNLYYIPLTPAGTRTGVGRFPEDNLGIIKLSGIAANFQHKADTASVVVANVIGGY